ncbi:hypothetical protein MNBD_IGNAVI01-2461 [hydrothermal vent metagenome]|uniref:Heparan-alpha-glucosaminide N-acetyltransferase catalytic domain-containing protein n=1 Tax=hydrothermal vent metagenome TaxID=652676 RepID=A0A3B1CUL4_9ZZZZ
MDPPKNRILYLDLMRAFAIFMMLQGHTVSVFLSDQYRSMDSVVYSSWYIIRGYTAPIFMFTAGVVFTYLLTLKKFSFKENPRIKKGIKRGISLILIGYILRYPTYKVFVFSGVTTEQWLTFFAVDALHLIGAGLLFILILEWFASISKVNNSIIFMLFATIVLIASPWVNSAAWVKVFPIPVASYFTFEFGSIFPFFPYLQYMFVGAVIGALLSKYPNLYKNMSANFVILVFGIVFVLLSRYIYSIVDNQGVNDYSQSLNRIGVVLILNSVFALISLKIRSIPRYIITAAKSSLSIYIIHLVILYGSPWSLGLDHLFGRSFSVSLTIISTIIMITLMILISLRIDKFRLKKKSSLLKSNSE